jgi:hypothetical protein
MLQTVVDVAAEKNSTLVMPFPVELLRFFDRATSVDMQRATSGDEIQRTAGGEVPPTSNGQLPITTDSPADPG